MAIYTVHVPEAAADDLARFDGTVLVREGFSGRAFLFGLLYLLWHRLWVAAAVWVAILILLVAVAAVLHPPAFFLVALIGLMHLYLATEGLDLIRGRLDRRGKPMRGLVSAPDLDTAEAVFFARHPVHPAASPPPRAPIARSPPSSSMPAIIGLFPDGSGA